MNPNDTPSPFVRLPNKRFDEMLIGSFFIVFSGRGDVHLYEKKSLSTAYELELVSDRVAVRTGFIINVKKAQEVIYL